MAKKKKKENTEIAPIARDTQEYGLEQVLADQSDIEKAREHSQYRFREEELTDARECIDTSEDRA